MAAAQETSPGNGYSHGSSSIPPEGSSTSILRVLCLHDANSNAAELSQQLGLFAEQLFLHHGIDLVFVNSPLLAPAANHNSQPPPSSGYQDPNLQPRVWWEEGEEEEEEAVSVDDNERPGDEQPSSGTISKKYVGLDASLLLLRQVWTSAPYWGIIAVGQAASVASFLPLMEIPTKPAFCVFLEGFSLLEEEELLIENLPCLHVVGKNPSKETERLVHQFGGEVSAGISSTGKAAVNRIGKFIVSQKKDLRLRHSDIKVLALQNQLFLAEQSAAQLVAQEIAENPPKNLMAVISPKSVGGVSGAKRRAPGEEGGGAPCPSDFLLQREKRTTNPNGPTREHPSQRQQQTQEAAPERNDNSAQDNNYAAITILIENPSKGNNLGPLLRCCSAFGVSRIYVVGYDQCAVQGSHGASRHVELVAFPTVQTAVDHLVKEEGFELIGLLKGAVQDSDQDPNQGSCPVSREQIQARPGNNNSCKREETVMVSYSNESMPIPNKYSFPAHLRQFSSRTCLVLDKKTKGLSWSFAQHCSSFVHIPHFASINNKQAVTTEACLSIVLYEFTTWAGFSNQSYKGQKYHVKQIMKGAQGDAELLEKKRLERQHKIEEQQVEANQFNAAVSNAIFLDATIDHDGDY